MFKKRFQTVELIKTSELDAWKTPRNTELTMIFTLFRKKVVNIEPLKMQAENRLDITYTLRSFEGSEETTIPHYPSHRKSQRFL